MYCPLSQRQLGLETEKKFKNVSHIWVDGKEEISLMGFINFQFGIDENTFNYQAATEESELWNMIEQV